MQTIRITAPDYPFLLKQITDQPDFLDCAGALPPSQDEYKYLCVIGSREYSDYGKDACIKLISGLRNFPIVIVSGLAIGIDSISHEQALKVGLKTISFPGSGLAMSSIYPPRHLGLAKRIVQSGNTLLSPFEKDNIGAPWTFPVRNRLMAGISHATLVIEGKPGSGTLLTAGNALEFNRDVMILPGSIFSALSYGPHLLYRDGAKPVFTSEDILETLGFDVARGLLAGTPGYAQPKQLELRTLSLSPEEMKIVKELQRLSQNATNLIESTGLSTSRFNILISQLELQGVVVEHGGIYRANGL